MVEDLNIQNLLQAGYWPNPRASSPAPSFTRTADVSRLDAHIPRSFDADSLVLSHRFPPPPSVEDEADSVAKEYGTSLTNSSDEEPRSRGDVNQFPLILPVPEYNPERRFVLVQPSETTDEESVYEDPVLVPVPVPGPPKPIAKSGYEANTGRKVLLDSEQDELKRPPPERRKSRAELPRIETNVLPNESRSSRLERTRSATYIDQKPRDYFDTQQESSRPGGEGFLSPVIKHSSKGRDRAYWDFSAGGAGANSSSARSRSSYNEPRGPSEDRRSTNTHQRPTSSSPMAHKRSVSAVELPKDARRISDKYGPYIEEISSPRARRRDPSPHPTERKRSSPPRRNRSDSFSLREQQSERGKLSRRNSSYKRRPPSPPEDDLDYSSDEYKPRTRRDRRKSNIKQEDRNSLLSPDHIVTPQIGRPKSRNTTPVASPRSSQGRFPTMDPSPSPRASMTFPPSQDKRRHEQRGVSPFSSGDSSSPRDRSRPRGEDKTHDTRPLSRAASLKSNASTTKPVIVPTPIPNATQSIPIDRRRSPHPPPSYSRHSSLEASPPKPFSQPEPFRFSPPRSETNMVQPVVSYRRYSESVSQGLIPGLPECSRKVAQPGHADWLTFARYDNFNICPSCYEQIFANTEFRNQFVPAPSRPKDKPVACDMGSSPWYRIAWLMTRKYGYADLRLMHSIATVAAKHQPCNGGYPVVRTWYSMRDPWTGCGMTDFNVCHHCAKAVEGLFPSLVGVLQPVLSQPVKDVCALHFTPERTRFSRYFDLLETTYDRAVATKSAPDIQRLADHVLKISSREECHRDEPVRDSMWYYMDSVRQFTVCEDCFQDVVMPEIDAGSTIARNFIHKSDRLNLAACQLYSERMRDVFRKACRNGDKQYLESKVRERLEIEKSIKKQLTSVMYEDIATEADKEEVARLLEEWKKWE